MSGNEVCDNALWKGALVVEANHEFDPVAWAQDDELGSKLQDYVKNHLLRGSAVSLALAGLVLVSLIVFLLWRLGRCCFSRCCSQPSKPVDPYRVLCNPWLTYHKVLTVIFGVAAIAMAVAGMIKLPNKPYGSTNDTLDAALLYGDTVLDSGDRLLSLIEGIDVHLDGINTVLDIHLNASAIRAELSTLRTFLNIFPDPSLMKATLIEVDRLVVVAKPQMASLSDAISGLQKDLSPLQRLAGTGDLLQTIQQAADNYIDKLSALPITYPGSASAQTTTDLEDAQAQIQFPSWRSQLLQLIEDVDTLDRMVADRTAGNLADLVTSLRATATDVLPPLNALLAGLRALNASDPVTAAATMATLSARLLHINTTVVALDGDTAKTHSTLIDTYTAIATLYCPNSGNIGLAVIASISTAGVPAYEDLCSPSTIGGTGAGLNLEGLEEMLETALLQLQPLSQSSQLSDLAAAARSAQDTLSNMPGTSSFTDLLSQVHQGLLALQPLSDAVQHDLSQHIANPSDATYSTLFSSAQPTRAAFGIAAPYLTTTPTGSSKEVMDLAVDANSYLGGVSTSLEAHGSVLQEVQKVLDVYPSGSIPQYIEMLDKAGAAYNSLPSPKAQLVDAPLLLMDRALAAADEGIVGVRQQVADTSKQVRDIFGDLREGGIAEVRDIQGDATDEADKYWGYAYKGIMGGYGLVVLVVLVLMAVAVAACPGGLVAALIVVQVVVVVWLVLGVMALAVMVALQDGCDNAEVIIVGQVGRHEPSLVPVADYFLYGTVPAGVTAAAARSGTAVEGVFAAADVVDVAAIHADIDVAQATLIEQLQTEFTMGTVLSGAVVAASQAVDSAQDQVDLVLQLADHKPVHSYYVALKSSVCCEVGGHLFFQWIAITISGMLAWLACVFARFLLARLDQLPTKNCMGCQCFRASQFNARPHPRHDGDGTRGTQRLPSWYSSGGATDITDTTRGSGGGVPSCAMDSDAGFTMLGPGMPPENAPKKSKMGHSSGGGAGGFSAGGAAPHYTYGFDPHMASDVLRANTGGSTGTPSSFQTIAPVTPLTHTYTNSSMVSATPSAAAAASLPPYGPADYFGAAGDEGPWAEAPQPQQASAPPAPAPMLPPPSAWSQEWVPSGSPYPNIDGTARIQ